MSISDGNRGKLTAEVLAKRRELNWETIRDTQPNGVMSVVNIDDQDEIIVKDDKGAWHMYNWEFGATQRWVVLFSNGPFLVEA